MNRLQNVLGCLEPGAAHDAHRDTSAAAAAGESAAEYFDERRKKLVHLTFMDYQPHSTFMKNPISVTSADGVYYYDIHGKRFFDGIGGIYTCVLGHKHPAVLKAAHAQLDKLSFAPPMHGICEPALDLIEKLSKITPGTLNFAKTFCSASEAMESAIKFTRQYHKQSGNPSKYKFISRYQSYHGATLGAMSASGTGKRKTPFEPMASGFCKVQPPSYYRDKCPGMSWEGVNRFCAQLFEDVIIGEDPATIAGIIVEPIGNTGGIITPTEEYFAIIRDICTRHNVTMILDETITGFGKTGHMFAAETFGVVPDMIVCGKGLSSGVVPVAAMIAREDMALAFQGDGDTERFFAHGHTYANNPLACAVASAVIDTLVGDKLCERAQVLGARLRAFLNGLKKHGVVREVRGRGVLLGVELMQQDDTKTPWPELGTAMKKTALDRGLIARIDANWFALSPALTCTDAELAELCALVEASLVAAIAVARAAA